jgi:NADPH2:quinone reductase
MLARRTGRVRNGPDLSVPEASPSGPLRSEARGSVARMQAIVLDSHGGPEVLRLRDIPDPVPGPDEVLVDVTSTAVNRADVLQRLGLYPYPGRRPEYDVPGLELAGRVAAVGERVTAWRPGDRVMGIVTGGGYATHAVVHERQLLRIPDTVTDAEAGSIPEVWITAFDALVVQCGMRAGDTVLVHAGASGVGTAAVQLAKAIGATCFVTASTSKIERCLALGADAAVDYTVDDFAAVCRDRTGGRGVDIILDVVGGDYLDRDLDVAALKGRIVQVGTMGAGRAQINLGKLMTKRLTLVGTVLRARPLEEKIAVTQRFAHEVLPGFASGRYRTVIDSTFALAEAGRAHERVETNQTFGKVLLTV